MRILSSLAVVASLSVAAAPALADSMKYYPYHGKNFCPAGLQPISVGGVICCGTPNTHATYREIMQHPVSHAPTAFLDKGEVAQTAVCEEGQKGC